MPWDELKPRRWPSFDTELDGISKETMEDLYFGHLGGECREPEGRFADLVEQEFNAVNKWLESGKKASQNLWAVHNMAPVLALDVYEHAYTRDFGATPDGRKQYVEAFFRNVDWDHVNRQLAQAEAAREGAQRVGAEEQVPTA
jgi:superoxide dismutase